MRRRPSRSSRHQETEAGPALLFRPLDHRAVAAVVEGNVLGKARCWLSFTRKSCAVAETLAVSASRRVTGAGRPTPARALRR